ncbi:MAG: tRNA (adenosine(37)-N6)-threonylcarbamoyltransferase complex ATPase subunit type 1 TsaE [Patescibacteria group bacterium]
MPMDKTNLKYEKIVNLKGLGGAAFLVLGRIASDKNRAGAAVIGLYGNLGSGKTAFVKKIGKILGVKEKIISPTFIIMKRYAIPAARRRKFNLSEMVHIDAYRLGSHEEILKLNWPGIIKNKKQAIFIEWPERVKKVMPKNALKIRFSFIDEKKRKVKILP